MPFFHKTNENQIRKVNTGADFERSTSVLKDNIHVVTAAEESSRIVNVGFFYNIGTHELEVTKDGTTFYRVISYENGTPYGDYTEISNYEIQFEAGKIAEDDVLRFRMTSNSYDRSDDNANNLQQLSRDFYGRNDSPLLFNDGLSAGPHATVVSTYKTDDRGDSYLNDAAIQSALDDISSNDHMIRLTRGNWYINNSVTIPSNVTVAIDDGAKIYCDSTASLHIDGVVFAGAYQVFFGSNNGNVTVSSYPRDDAWWGLPQKLWVYSIDSALGGLGLDATAHVYIRDVDRDTTVTCDLGWVDEDKIRFITGGTNAMIIDDSQNVGIGTMSPSVQLDVEHSSDTSILRLGGDTVLNSSEIRLADTGDGYYWSFRRLGADHPSQPNDLEIGFYDSSFDRYIRMDESTETVLFNKWLGIGTITASKELDVGNSGSEPTIRLKRIDSTIETGNAIGNLDFTGTDGGSESAPQIGARILGRAKENWETAQCGTGIEFYTCDINTSTLDFRMIVDEDGNVGIGDFSASTVETKLHVLGTVMATAFSSSSPLILQVNTTEAMRIVDTTYYAGIGSTVPSSRLDVASNDAEPVLTIKRIDSSIADTDDIGSLRFVGTDGASEGSPHGGASIKAIARASWSGSNAPSDLIIATTPSGGVSPTEVIRVTYDGKVGIGDSTPAETLTINGGVNIGDTSLANNGTIRFHNDEFQGYDGTSWAYLGGGTGYGGSLWSMGSGNDIYYQPAGDTVIIGASSAMSGSTLYLAENNDPARVTFLRDDTSISGTTTPEVLGIIDFAGLHDSTYTNPYIGAQIASICEGSWAIDPGGSSFLEFRTTPSKGGADPNYILEGERSVRIKGVYSLSSSTGGHYSSVLINTPDTINITNGYMAGLVVGCAGDSTASGHPTIVLFNDKDIVSDNDEIGRIGFYGKEGGISDTTPRKAAAIVSAATQDWSGAASSTAAGANLEFWCVENDDTDLTKRFEIGGDGNTYLDGSLRFSDGTPPSTINGTLYFESSEFKAYESGTIHDVIAWKTIGGGSDHAITGKLKVGALTSPNYAFEIVGSTRLESSMELECNSDSEAAIIVFHRQRAGGAQAQDGDLAGAIKWYAASGVSSYELGKIEVTQVGVESGSPWEGAGGKMLFSCDRIDNSGSFGPQLIIWGDDVNGGKVGIGIGDAEPDCLLHVDGAIKLSDNVATGSNGMIRYNTSTNKFEGYSSGWKGLGGTEWAQGLFSNGDATPSVSGDYTVFYTNNSVSTTITNFDNGTNGQIIYVGFNDSNTTIAKSATIYPQGGVDFSPSAYDMVVFARLGGIWREVSRSINS